MNIIQGIIKRFGCAVPQFEMCYYDRVHCFVHDFIVSHFKPIPLDTDVSVSTWLASCKYPLWRKNELLNCDWDGTFVNKSHVKREFYPEYKYCRLINSRIDGFKRFCGPYFKIMESIVYSLPWFIKHIPVCDRPSYIMEHIQRDGCVYICSDHTAFESHFVPMVMELFEMQLYKFLLINFPGVYDVIHRALCGVNKCYFSDGVSCELNGVRMSGDMCTSLGNGFTNLMVMMFMLHDKDLQFNGVVEGDDGLFGVYAPYELLPTCDDFKNIGMDLKLELRDSVSTSDFCGLVFDPVLQHNLCDPAEALCRFGWSFSELRFMNDTRPLVRAKAISLAYECPNCPILNSLARYGLRVTSGVLPRFERLGSEVWWREQLNIVSCDDDVLYDKLCVDISDADREIVQTKFGVDFGHQILIERYLDSLSCLCEFSCSYIDDIMRQEWKHFYDHFCN
jgi:hypothetical protein